MGVRVGFVGVQVGFRQRHATKSPPPPWMADSVSAGTLMLEIDLGAMADIAIWGYGVDPPADINPHLAWCRACQPDPVGTATGGPSSWTESGYRLRRPGDPGCALPCPAPSLNRLAQRRPGAGRPCDTGYVIRTAQITGLFDLWPLLAVPSREVHERSTAGTSQVSKRSAKTGAATAKPRAGSTMAGRCLLHSSAPVHGDTPVPAGFSRRPADYARATPSARQ